MINIILLLLIFVSCCLLTNQVMIKWQLSKYKNKSNSFFQTKEIQFKNFISKINFIKTKEIFLFQQGYPLNLDSIRYYFLKTMLASLFFIAGNINYNSLYYAVILASLGYFFIDIYILVHKKDRDSEICCDVLSVINSLCLQLSAHVSLQNSIKNQYKNCKNKDFKKAMIEFATYYELSEFDIEKSTQQLKQKFNILELDLFCNALNEYNQSASIVEVLENLAELLDEKQMEKIKEITRNKIIYITFGVVIALTNIILLTFYPLFVSIGQGFQNIFR